MTGLLLEGARLPGAPAAVDVLVDHGIVAEIVPHGAPSAHAAGAERLRLDGRWLIPGLHDRHVHLSQWAMVSRRLDLSGAASAADATRLVAASVAGGAVEVIGFGYRDGLWPDAPTRAALDAVSGDVPVVLVAADLHACWVNSAAARRHRRDVQFDRAVDPGQPCAREQQRLRGLRLDRQAWHFGHQ